MVSFCSSFVYRNCSSGEGIFTFYCRRSRELVVRLTATSKNQPLSSIEGKKSSHYKMNPILALLRRGSSSSSSTSNSGNHNSRSKSKKQFNKSASSADHLDKTGGFEASVAPPVALGRRGFSLERPLENIEKKKSASESNLLAAAATSNDIAPTTADTGHSAAFKHKLKY